MHACTRVGIDVTWACGWRCLHCFYRRNPKLHTGGDVPFWKLTAKIDQAKAGGLDHVLLVGYGEPSLAKTTPRVLDYAHKLGMATSMISNVATGLDKFKGYFAQGLDHLHISSHGLDGTLDDIVEVPGAFRRQAEIKDWLASESLPFRTNVALQRRNYRELAELAEYEIEHGVFHFVFLGFLPHYEWRKHVREVAIHPAILRPYIEDGAECLLAAGTHFTIRYHPFCHLAPKYWPYVVNARYVAFDPWEWNYSLQVHDLDALWRDSMACGDSVAIKDPCDRCSARRHCGGWNRVYAEAFGGADLVPIEGPPDEYREVWDRDGGLHDLNPVNALTGTIQMKDNTSEIQD